MKKIIDELVSHPMLTSVMIVDFALLLFHRPPALISLIMLVGLVALSLFFGQKLALFNTDCCSSSSTDENAGPEETTSSAENS